MLPTTRVVAVVAAAAAYVSSVAAISKITRSGRYLYDEGGNRFYIKGIAYQPEGTVESSETNTYNEPTDFIDPLSNSTGCARDLPYLKQLGVNTIRVYSVNSTENHDECMKQLSDAGIYTLLDLSLPQESITREDPVWATNLLNTYLATIDAFSKYDNVLGYNIGNEVVNAPNVTSTATFLKAAARDVKAYIKSKGYSGLVGYSSIDGAQSYRGPTAAYLSCDPSGSNSDATAIDLYGLNAYEYCDGDQYSTAYQGTTQAFEDYNVVAYFSEFGNVCNGRTRQWSDVPLLYGSEMASVWSGGIAFSYFPRTSAGAQFGMATISSDGSSVSTNDDFSNLAQQYTRVSAPNSPTQSNAGAASYPTCPAQSSNFHASTTLPPTPDNAACSCLRSSVSCYFQPNTNNLTTLGVTIGNVFGSACELLGSSGGSCDALSADGETGQYGLVSQCDAQQKLSYVMSLYYESQNKNPTACSFNGVGFTRSSSASASAVASSCLANAQGSSVPSGPASTSSGRPSATRSSTSTPGSGDNSAAVSLSVSSGMLGAVAMVLASIIGGAMTVF